MAQAVLLWRERPALLVLVSGRGQRSARKSESLAAESRSGLHVSPSEEQLGLLQ